MSFRRRSSESPAFAKTLAEWRAARSLADSRPYPMRLRLCLGLLCVIFWRPRGLGGILVRTPRRHLSCCRSSYCNSFRMLCWAEFACASAEMPDWFRMEYSDRLVTCCGMFAATMLSSAAVRF